MTLTASCTWGEGPDVLMVLEDDGKGDALMAYEHPHHHPPPRGDCTYGYIRKGSICLTADQAESLGYQLIESVKQARGLDKEYTAHCEAHHKAQIESDMKKEIKWKNIPPDGPMC
ncbi:hypothetical protein LCGC14_2597540 [marine sediment metagenome]|uniref:Uncharacterized protein n=1 Tax=marine sediment metagenome TaxID=412755 RepID=A0A0F9AXL8_9ZZZZ